MDHKGVHIYFISVKSDISDTEHGPGRSSENFLCFVSLRPSPTWKISDMYDNNNKSHALQAKGIQLSAEKLNKHKKMHFAKEQEDWDSDKKFTRHKFVLKIFRCNIGGASLIVITYFRNLRKRSVKISFYSDHNFVILLDVFENKNLCASSNGRLSKKLIKRCFFFHNGSWEVIIHRSKLKFCSKFPRCLFILLRRQSKKINSVEYFESRKDETT